LPHYIIAWLIILIVWTAVFHWLDFYRPRRLSGQKPGIVEVLKGCSLAMLIFLGVLFLLRGCRSFSDRGAFLLESPALLFLILVTSFFAKG